MNESLPLEVTPERSFYYPGDIITCKAYGTPPIAYRWRDQNNPANFIWNADLTIEKTHTQQQEWSCEAYNYPIGDEHVFSISRIITFDVYNGEYYDSQGEGGTHTDCGCTCPGAATKRRG